VATFASSEEVEKIVGGFLEQAIARPDFIKKFADTQTIFRITYTNPEAIVWLDCKYDPPRVLYGADTGLAEDVSVQMEADLANRFWLGKLNLVLAMAQRQVKTKGPTTKMMKLLPLLRPLFAEYKVYLARMGRDDLLASA
jgi:hypothetical protein